MSTHNTRGYIDRAIHSLNTSLAGRRWALVVADDGSKDGVLGRVRELPTTAHERVLVACGKASSVSAAKQRAMDLAQPLLARYPWVGFMDDDDECLPGRFGEFLGRLEANGQLAGVGDSLFSTPGTVPTVWGGDWMVWNRVWSPGMSVVHRDVVRGLGGEYFLRGLPAGVVDDRVAHWRVTMAGVPWCWHGGPLVFHHHRRGDSCMGPLDNSRGLELVRGADEWVRANLPGTATSIRAVCVLAYGRVAEDEVRVLVGSMRVMGNRQEVVVWTDAVGARRLADLGGHGVKVEARELPDDPRLEGFRGVYPSYDGRCLLAKMKILEEVSRERGGTLYLDADTVVLGKWYDVVPAGHMGLVPRMPGAKGMERYGRYNAGQVYVDGGAECLRMLGWWREKFLDGWREWRVGGGVGCFSDQGALDGMAAEGRVWEFHGGHDVGPEMLVPGEDLAVAGVVGRPAVGEVGGVKRVGELESRWGLWYGGWPVMSVHCHFGGRSFVAQAPGVFREMIGHSQVEGHRKVAGMLARMRRVAP